MRRELLLLPALLLSGAALAQVEWQELDQNGDDRLEPQDLMQAPIFNQWDENGDGVLSKPELEKHGGEVSETLSRGRRTGMNAEPQVWGQPLDTDGDNQVSRQEYADGLIAVYDDNGDGIVQRQEWPQEDQSLIEKLRPGD